MNDTARAPAGRPSRSERPGPLKDKPMKAILAAAALALLTGSAQAQVAPSTSATISYRTLEVDGLLDAGHFALDEKVDEIARLIRSFLDRNISRRK